MVCTRFKCHNLSRARLALGLAHGVSFSASYQLMLQRFSDDISCSTCHRLLLGTITCLGLAHGVFFFASYQPKLAYYSQPLFYRS